MSKISIISTLQRGSNGVGSFPVAIEDDLATSYVTVATTSDRDTLPEWKRRSNMVCHVIGDNKDYQLGSDVTIPGQVWTQKTYNVPADVLTQSQLFDTNGYIKPQYIQNIFLNTNFVVGSQAAMLALTTFTGNFVIRTDTGAVWIKLNNTNPSSLSDFALATPSASVVSVNGQTGVVNITIANLLADSTNLTNFNTAVSNNATVLGHSSSIASLNSNLSALTTYVGSYLPTYVDTHLGGQLLDPSIESPSPTQDGYVVKWNQSLGKYILGVVTGGGGGGGSLNFKDLLDVPASYTGQGLKVVRVKSTEDGLEFVTSTSSIASLTDVSLSGLADANLFLYKTSDAKWHNIAMSGDSTISNTGVTTVNWTNGYTTYDTRYLKLSGGTMTGLLTLSGDPLSSLQAATKNYVDNLVTGLTWKAAAQVATTVSITLSGLQTIDGYTTIAGDRVLVKDQSTQTQNGLYIAAIGSWVRTLDADTGIELLGSTVYVENGTLNNGTQWNNNNSSITLGSTNITFVKIAGAGVYTNGTGLSLSGNVFSITTNGVTNSLIRQSAGLSVIGNATNSTANVADITGTNNQVLRVSGTTLGFGSIDLSQSATVGSSVLGVANGGTGSTSVNNYLLASGGTASASNTFTFNTANWANFNGTLTATANNQYYFQANPTFTARNTASDTFYAWILKAQLNTNATTQNPIGYNLDIDQHLTGGVNTFTTLQSNTTAGCTNGTITAFSGYTYTNQDGTGTSPSGATFNVTVTANAISSIVVNAAGTGYKIGDKFLFNGSSFGGSGSVFFEVVSLTNTLGTNATAQNILLRTYVPALAGVVTPVNKWINFQVLDNTGTPTTKAYLGWYISGGSTSTVAFGDNFGEIFNVNASSINFTRAVSTSAATTFGGAITTREITYNGVNSGTSSSLAFLNSPVTQKMAVASQWFSLISGTNTINSGVPSGATIVGGSGYTNGTYNGSFAATGGTGTGFSFSQVVVSGGAVASVIAIPNNAINYRIGDVLSVANTNIGGTGSGFTYTLTAVDFNNTVFSLARNTQTITDNATASSVKYLNIYDNRTITQNGTANGAYFASYEFNPASITGTPILYGILIRPTTALNGFGVSNPLVTMDIAGGLATRATSPGSISSSQNDYAIGAGTFFRLTASTPVNITGFTGGSDGKIMTIRNVGANAITITNEDVASTAANRITSSTGANIVLNAKGAIILVYDASASRWLDFALR